MSEKKGFLIAAVAVSQALALNVAGGTYKVDIDRPEGLYRCGETATFTVRLLETNGLAALKQPFARLDNFGAVVLTNMPFDVTATGVLFTASGTLREPGFLRLSLPATKDGRSDPCVFSVGFEPEKIRKGSPSPMDFDAFWSEARARLAREVPIDAQVVRVAERSTPDFDFFRISFATFGRRVHGYMSVPTDKSKAPFPVDFGVNAAGFGNWTNDMTGEKDSIRVQFSVYPFPPDWKWRETGLEAEYKAMDAEGKSKYGALRYCQAGITESREAYFFYPVILGIDRAVDWVAARLDVDRSRFRYQGTSQGGGFGFYLCGLNRAFTRAAFYVPAITDTMGYLAGRRSGWPQIVENNSGTPERRAAAEKWAPYFDGANFASRIKCPVRVAVGFSDTTCPPCAVYAAYNEIKVADKAIGNGIGMTHSCSGRFYSEFGAWAKGVVENENPGRAAVVPAGFATPRVVRTIRPAGTGFFYNPGLNTFLPLNDDYDVSLDGLKVEVRACRESRIPFNRYWPGRQRPLDQTERASYLAFEAEGAVACTVKPKWKCTKAVVRPLSAGVKPVLADDGTISFMLPKTGSYVLETDGPHKALHIFMERPRSFPERDGATLSYGPGMHIAGLVRLKSHDRVYIDRDAIVFGCFTGENVEDVQIFGHGVIDGRVCERVFEGCYTPLQQSCLRFHGSKGIEIDGPILMDSPCWVLACFDCEDVDIRHVKIVGQWRYNTDGIDICNSRRVTVRDCFVRAFDDAMVIKGVPPYKDKAVEDITVERCVLWCGWGNTVEPGVETWAPHFRNVCFSDCDLIRNSRNALNVSAGGSALMEDFLFENIRVEMQADDLPEMLQRSEDQKYDSAGRRSFPVLVKVDNNQYVKIDGEPLGHVRNCTFRNIAVLAEPGVPPPSIRVMSRTPTGGEMRPFENVKLEGFSINGRADWSAFNFATNTPVALRP